MPHPATPDNTIVAPGFLPRTPVKEILILTKLTATPPVPGLATDNGSHQPTSSKTGLGVPPVPLQRIGRYAAEWVSPVAKITLFSVYDVPFRTRNKISLAQPSFKRRFSGVGLTLRHSELHRTEFDGGIVRLK
jgi:hypothetical protein